MRGQINFINMGHQTDAGPGMTHWAGRGILECPVGSLKPEHMYDFVSFGHRRETMLSFMTGQKDVAEQVVAHEMGSTFLRDIWPMPRKGSGHCGGGMLLRRSTIPSRPGTETMLVAMLLRGRETGIEDRHMYRLQGDLAIDGRMLVMDDPRRCEIAERNGEGLNWIYHRPVWGWEDEPIGIRTLMDQATVALCEEYLDLDLLEDRTVEQTRRLADLRRTEAHWVVGTKEEAYIEYRKRLFARHGRRAMSGVDTARQIEEHETRVMALIREIKAEEEQRWAA